MQQYIIIKGDTNDADYTTAISKITNEQLAEIQPVIDAIIAKKKTHPWEHNWPIYEYADESPKDLYPQLTEDQIAIFEEGFVPSGIHSIDSIKVWQVAEEKTFLE